jgi:hypothetical protein
MKKDWQFKFYCNDKKKTFYLISDSAWAGSLKRTAKSKLQQGRAGMLSFTPYLKVKHIEGNSSNPIMLTKFYLNISSTGEMGKAVAFTHICLADCITQEVSCI